MRVGITGCRPPKLIDAENSKILSVQYGQLIDKLDAVICSLKQNDVIVHGGATGIDSWAQRIAELRYMRTEIHLPNYTTHGKRAPLVRNAYVTTCDIVHAFPAPWSRGTWQAIKLARKAGVETIVHEIK